MNFHIVYFSGTGGTKMAASTLSKDLISLGHSCECHGIGSKEFSLRHDLEHLIIMYPLHAFSVPEPMRQWLTNIESVLKPTPCSVITCSGGGNISGNNACRLRAQKILGQKGYTCNYEDMIAMPVSLLYETPAPIASTLVHLLPVKIKQIALALDQGLHKSIPHNLFDWMCSQIGPLESIFTRAFGRSLVADQSCTCCKLCSNQCPVNNIKQIDGRIEFGDHCIACMRCVYQCNSSSIHSKHFQWMISKNGYNLRALQKQDALKDPVQIQQICKGWVWKGVRQYILELLPHLD